MSRHATQAAMFSSADLLGHQVYVSCDKDKPGKHSKKWFTHFSSYDSFSAYVEGLSLSQRSFYEILREGRAVNMYLDIEFIGPPEYSHGSLRIILQDLDENLRALRETKTVDTLGCKWTDHGPEMPADAILFYHSDLSRLLSVSTELSVDEIRAIHGLNIRPRHTIKIGERFFQVVDSRPQITRHVTCSSRVIPETGLYKNSYHVVYPCCVLECNSCGMMQKLVSQLCCTWALPRHAEARTWKVVPDIPEGAQNVTTERLRHILSARTVLTTQEHEENGLLERNNKAGPIYIETENNLVMVPRNGKEDGYIDLKVYTKNRMMRTVFSHKRGSDVCFRRVSELCSPDIATHASEWSGSFIGMISENAPWRFSVNPIPVKSHGRPTIESKSPRMNTKKRPMTIASHGCTKRSKKEFPPVEECIVMSRIGPGTDFHRVFLGESSALEFGKVDSLPYAVKEWTHRGEVVGVTTFYIKQPKQCVHYFLEGKTKQHTSNNSMGVLISKSNGNSEIFMMCMDDDCRQKRRCDVCNRKNTQELPGGGKSLLRIIERYSMDPNVDKKMLEISKKLVLSSSAQRHQLLKTNMLVNIMAWKLFLADSWVLVPRCGFF